jgi:hypothetical protein
LPKVFWEKTEKHIKKPGAGAGHDDAKKAKISYVNFMSVYKNINCCRRMKGFVLWTLIGIILLFAFLVVAVPMVYGSVGNAVRVSALINAEQVVGIVNIMESSPVASSYKFFLPDADCKISLKSGNGIAVLNFSVSVGDKQEYLTEVIERNVTIHMPAEGIKCETGREKEIYFMRCGNRIEISEIRVPCDV